MDLGAQKVLLHLTTTHDQTERLIECVEKNAEEDVEAPETARGTDSPEQEENEREELEELFISHLS